MKIFFAIIRWMFALGIAAFVFIFTVVTIPMSVLGTQLLDSTSATRVVNAITADQKAMDSFTEGMFQGMASNRDSNMDPAVRQMLATMSNPNSALGKSARRVITSTIVAKNIKENSTSFYNWLDAKVPTLNFTFYVGGTKAEQVNFVSEMLKVRYDALRACTSSEKATILKSNISSSLELECSVGTLKSSYFISDAAALVNSKEIQPYLNTGKPLVTKATEKDREAVLVVRKFARAGLVVTWIVLLVGILFMVLLFTPSGVNWIMTGGIVGVIGLTLLSLGGGAVALLGKANPYGTATETIAEAFGKTLGKPITVQGLMILLIGVVLFVIGVLSFLKKQPKKTDSMATTTQASTIPVAPVATPSVAVTTTAPTVSTPAPQTEVKAEEKKVEEVKTASDTEKKEETKKEEKVVEKTEKKAPKK